MTIARKQHLLGLVVAIWITSSLAMCSIASGVDDSGGDDLFDMSLEELMNIDVSSTASLTETSGRHRPTAMTTIGRKEIEESGARSLDELLEIYVPNLEIVQHLWEPQHLGLRGSVSDRDDKYLLLVNGRVMNERLHYGALSERDLPLLQDIHHVDVIRGPGSVLYGPGALFMVVNIVTDNAETFQGMEVTSRFGAVDEFSGIETKYGKQFDDGSGLFLYAGVADQDGASPDDAEFYPGRSWTIDGVTISGAEPLDNPLLPNHNSAYRDLARLKFYGQYQKKDLTFWTRYTRSGTNYYPFVASLDHDADGADPPQGSGYQQLTVLLGDKVRFSDDFDFDGTASFDILDYERQQGSDLYASRQDEIHLRGLFNWRPAETFSAAFGGEYFHDQFGRQSFSQSDLEPKAAAWGADANMPSWHTDTFSILGEVQWQFADRWSAFLGGRIDWHTFINDAMVSPRIAVIHDLTEKDTLKFIVSDSVRASTAEDMKRAFDEGHKSDYEDMRNFELHWNRQQTSNLWFGCSTFFNERHVVAWDQGNSIVTPLGDMSIYGAELEILYKTDKTSLGLSHGYSQLCNFKLDDPSTDQFFTTEPYGYGDDLAVWHDHITKFNISHNVTDRLNVSGSMVVYWGSPGRKDYLAYTRDNQSWDYTEGVSADRVGDPSYFLNLGLQYTVDKHLKIAAHAYDVLGLFNRSLNHRDYAFSGIQRSSTMTTAPSASVTLIYDF